MDYQEKVSEFLRKYHQRPEDIDLYELTDNMLKDMTNGLENKESSLMMIPTYLATNGKADYSQPAIAIDAGGTNLRVALVSFSEDGKTMVLEGLKKQKMLGVDKPLSKDEFFEGICQLCLPLLDKTDKIGFCFSFPCEIQPNKDGRIIYFSKEVNVIGAEGALIGEEMKKWFKAHGVDKELSIVILNDTVATLLGGPAIVNTKSVDGQIGLIVGTGVNTAYSEDVERITKLPVKAEGKMIINMEAGGFNKFPMGEFEKRMDNNSANPGDHELEKCISGVYLGNVIAYTIKQAAKEGLFSEHNRIADLPYFTMVEVDAFLRDPYGHNLLADACSNDDDVETMYCFIDQAIDRGAKLICGNLSACMIKMDGGKKRSTPVRIVVEGSTFHRCYSYKQKVEYYLRTYTNERLNRYYTFVTSDDANMAGSAIAVLLNS